MANSNSIKLIFVLLLFCGIACESSERRSRVTEDSSEKKETPLSEDLKIEFALDLPEAEKERNSKIILSFPEFKNVEQIVSKFGFELKEMKLPEGARESPIKGELTGLIFNTESKRSLEGLEYRVMLMGPTKDRVEDIRIQSYGEYSSKPRKKLLEWADRLLKQLHKGKVPDSFSNRMLSGKSVSGDEHFSNGSCELSVLQKPWPNPELDPKRISLDIGFVNKESE